MAKKAKLHPAQLIIGMRASYHHGKYRQVFTGNIIRIIYDSKHSPAHVFIGGRWVKADQLFTQLF